MSVSWSAKIRNTWVRFWPASVLVSAAIMSFAVNGRAFSRCKDRSDCQVGGLRIDTLLKKA